MSEEMAVGDNPKVEEPNLNSDDATAESSETKETVSLTSGPDSTTENPDASVETEDTTPAAVEDIPKEKEEEEQKMSIEEELASLTDNKEVEVNRPEVTVEVQVEEQIEANDEPDSEDVKRGIKRRASTAFNEAGDDDFKGFEQPDDAGVTSEYNKVLDRLEAEVTAAVKDFTPVKIVMATPPVPTRASKRARQDASNKSDGSRPSSALSSRSDEFTTDPIPISRVNASAASSPANRRRTTTEMSSPLLRVPLERGWKRELVYRAALDSHSRRNADIYYYTPQGKKLRSTREVGEQLSGTGLTLENFSFFKEPLGIDDPEKEIIRDAKLMRRVDSPVAKPAEAVEGKRTPKPKPPKGASPEPSTPKSPPAKLKVKSLGSRLSATNATPPAAPPVAKAKKQVPAADNNNTAAWKKPRLGAPAGPPAPPGPPATPPAPPGPPATTATPPAPAPPPLTSRPTPPEAKTGRQLVQPCSLTCGRGVPSLACAVCLCLYHPACAAAPPRPALFHCKNCRNPSSPPPSPPPLTHKSGTPAAPPRRPAPHPAPAKVTPKPKGNKRVLLRMKVSGAGAGGARVWAVSRSGVARPGQAPQSLAVINRRRFVVVPRQHEKRQTRLANGAANAATVTANATVLSPRRRGRPKVDDTDHFTAFCHKAQEKNYNVAVQIFQYLGMRELARCARVCRLWRDLAATPALWRHVRMKNSHVSDWGGLCKSLNRHGTKWLDLRKMLLPPSDAVFWEQFSEHISTVESLERIELCRCPASAVEAVCRGGARLRSLSALAIRDALLDPAPLAALSGLHELRLKSMSGLSLTRDLRPLAKLRHLQHLSLTSIKELGWCLMDVVGQLSALESLELGECSFRAEFAGVLSRLSRLRRLRLERGTAQCAAPALLRGLATLPRLTHLELVNVDVKVGFDDALAECKNIQRLLIIPTYVSQSATTNKQVLSGVLRLKDTLTHLMWGVTIELLRVTELFIDQCEAGAERRRDVGECIPVLKPVPGCPPARAAPGPPQVEILPLPTLQRLLSAQLPNTKLKLLRIPFHATWRQSLADFQ